ncbi:DEAD/DEAH box helicase [Cognatiyoonia sp. IB215182]|uniref:DEAD/DEAH box helicase n=1 Tax=Cognatiyoonia sp. IB215182 TaxID=3097353 RepID=UPI002A13DF26|nr:AAA domain-containing protein [Cognatiyoonia sp. IB215182]MDX8353960.1 AAA domain-containing protein [Cognatiyoonia sp. IB215182]
MANTDQDLLDKLSFWHKLEFFIPFDLKGRAEPQENRKKFWRCYRDTSPVGLTAVPKGMKVAGYTLFLGVFDKSEINGVVPKQDNYSDNDKLDDEQGADLEGETCMASIGLSAAGVPIFDDFQISTLPWAIGCSRNQGVSSLSSEAFSRAREKLKKKLQNFSANRPENNQTVDGENIKDMSLSPNEVDDLVDLLSDWSGFRPSGEHPAALLEVRLQKKEPETKSETSDISKSENEEDGEEEEEDSEEEVEEVPIEIGILNSFYIEDIEIAIKLVRAGDAPTALRQYLSPLDKDLRFDLYSEVGLQHIVNALSPERMNAGRWPTNPKHSMSLMQQFAINTGLDQLRDEGLFSVNGPPGTGKTTLLRDMIAENITLRAAVLSNLRKPSDAFQSGSDGIRRLIPELTGFEMVVASSNNAAVENISRDLPKGEAIWGNDLRYLQPVAHNIVGRDKLGKRRNLSDAERPWGLISAVMGRRSNRSQFVSKLFFDKASRSAWPEGNRPLTLWEWRSETNPGIDKKQNFQQASAAFKAAQSKVNAAISVMQKFHELAHLIKEHTEESWCHSAQQAVDKAELSVSEGKSQLEAAEQEYDELRSALEDLVTEGQLIEKTAPTWWKRLLSTKDARIYKRRQIQNAETQIELYRKSRALALHIKGTLSPDVECAKTAHTTALEGLKSARADWKHKSGTHSELTKQFGDVAPPSDLNDLEGDEIQIRGVWHTQDLAALRSDLFKAALRLHEAWLLAVSQKGGGFGANLGELKAVLANQHDNDPDICLALWQSLFMVVPVISSTFASVSRQFGGVRENSIGWLFVDEAGQAVPQAAVGALFRAKRAVVIGDPLQIEPVFTLPKKLISALAETSPITENGEYSPSRVSAQVLADRANRFGAYVDTGDDEPTWIGSPLRVHRRCIDPMFSIANHIAYEDQMVFGLPSRSSEPDRAPFWGESCWIDLRGAVQGRQVVPAQIDFVAQLIVDYCYRRKSLPKIYVISPFKEVKEHLVTKLRAPGTWSGLDTAMRTKRAINGWVSKRVGTVHTFQGKEEDAVIMILGADDKRQGAAIWAASKPNILNVALTRAKRRFYLIGDRSLWGNLPYFQAASRVLPIKEAQSFLEGTRLEQDP